MGFTRHTFPIRMIDGWERPIEIVSGWRYGDFGFHKGIKGRWIATDLYSGTRICTGQTRKECLEKIENNMKRIEQRYEEPSYIQKVMEFKELLKKESEEME